jgi:sulfopropanediol 3-dehydrogenase
MITQLKSGIPEEQAREADRKVRETVEGILADIETRGDAAIREYSDKFDRWAPADFRLSQKAIDELIARVDPVALDDIKFAQAQVRRFAEIQRGALRDVEVETLPGVTRTRTSPFRA